MALGFLPPKATAPEEESHSETAAGLCEDPTPVGLKCSASMSGTGRDGNDSVAF